MQSSKTRYLKTMVIMSEKSQLFFRLLKFASGVVLVIDYYCFSFFNELNRYFEIPCSQVKLGTSAMIIACQKRYNYLNAILSECYGMLTKQCRRVRDNYSDNVLS